MAEFKSEAWRRYWVRRPVTLEELVRLALGWDPASQVQPNHEAYRDTLEDIRRALRTSDPGLPPVQELRWPEIAAETIFATMPLFRLSDVWRWMVDRYPDTFPFTAEDFGALPSVGLPLPTRLALLNDLARSYPSGKAQKEIVALIRTRLGVGQRAADVCAALIKPDDVAASDGRSRRHLEAPKVPTNLPTILSAKRQ